MRSVCALVSSLWLSTLLLASTTSFAAPPKASSEATTSEGQRMGAALAFDGLLETAWAEGVSGAGVGEWLELSLPRATEVSSVSIWPGNTEKGLRSMKEFGRPHTVTVTLVPPKGGEPVVVQARILDPVDGAPRRVDVPVNGTAVAVRITLDQAKVGGLYDHVAIAEVAVNHAGGAVASELAKLAEYAESKPGLAAAEADKAEVEALYTRCASEELGDREAMNELMQRAGEGAPYLRKLVEKMIPAGFRATALKPDMVALEALLKLKDPVAIPAVELAASRETGAMGAALEDRVMLFRAFQALKGGGSRDVPPFGRAGFEKGALQGLGEPLAVAVDNFGGLWVADVGNNRVQRFRFDGIVERVVGAKDPAPSNAWLGGTRAWYPAGAAAGVGLGEFTLPLSLAVLPSKEGDGVAVLDASGRVTLLDGAGNATAAYALAVDGAVSPGVGGEAHLVRFGKKLCAIWGNEVVFFGMDGVELSRFSLKRGAPTDAVAFKDGKLGLVYGDALYRYSQDGFEHGELLSGALGGGFEAMSVTLDGKGKLWAALDTGEVVSFKKPGVVNKRYVLSEAGLERPRIAVYDGLVFVSAQDKVWKLDAETAEAVQ